jgi:hypothetical protein
MKGVVNRKRKEAARRGQAKAMKGRRCPKCGRGNALTRANAGPEVSANCRYCDYVRLRETP